MSKSSRKLLIVGGDSWSNPNESCYIEYGVNKIWPNIVADFLDMDLINISLSNVPSVFGFTICTRAVPSTCVTDL